MKALRLTALLLASTAALALDNDNDGMDDLWQQRHGIAPFTGSQDPDGDGRINLLEARNMSHPHQITTTPGIIYVKDLNPVDGLPDAWQQQFAITAAQKFEDPDGDLRTNLEESLVLSHPFVADIPFSLMANRPPMVERPGPDSFIARMPDSAGGRRYILEVSETLLPGSWTTATMMNNGSPYQWGTGDEISAEALTGNAPRMFFRWKIDDPDSDGDFLPDFLELQAGTDVNVADTDEDGIPDGNEWSGGTDALSASTFQNTAEQESEGIVPTVHLAYVSKYVYNDWHRIDYQFGEDAEHSGMGWETLPDGITGGDSQDSFMPLYEGKLAELQYPSTADGFASWAPIPGADVGYTGTSSHRDYSYANTTKYSVAVTHRKCIFRTESPLVQAPWKMTRHYVRALEKRPNPSGVPGPTTYSNIALLNLHIDKGQVLGSSTYELEPTVDTSKAHTDSLYPVKVTSSFSRSVDNVSALNLSQNPKPDTWVMLPQGETRTLTVSYGPNATHNIYQLDGAGFDSEAAVPRSGSTLTLNSTSTGTAALRAGFSTTGTLGGATLLPEPLIRVAVYERKELNVVVVPIAYQILSGGPVTYPQDTPSPEALQAYLDGVFLQQVNIKMNVSILPPVPVAWDRGLGPEMFDTLNRGANDWYVALASPINQPSGFRTAEEAAIFTAAPPSTDQHTLTVYYVWGRGLIEVGWAGDVEETNHNLSQLKYRTVWGYAPYEPSLTGSSQWANVAWVVDRKASGFDDVKYTIAHEIGHKLGLKHCLEAGGARLLHGDNENRLMTGRVGSKRNLGPIRLIHQEWDTMRGSQLLRIPPNP